MLMEVVFFVASLGALWMGIERVLFARPDAGLYLILGAVLLIGAAILSRLRYDQKQQQRRQSCATAERRKPSTPTRAWGAREMMTALQREDRGEAGADRMTAWQTQPCSVSTGQDAPAPPTAQGIPHRPTRARRSRDVPDLSLVYHTERITPMSYKNRDSTSFAHCIPDAVDGTLMVVNYGHPWMPIFLRSHPDCRLRLWFDHQGRQTTAFAPADARQFMRFLLWRAARARSGESLVHRYMRQRRK